MGRKGQMKQRLFNLLAAVSLVLCFAVAVLAARQRSQPFPEIAWGDSRVGTRYRLVASYAYVQFLMDSSVQALPEAARAGSFAEVGRSWRIAGIGYQRWNDIGLGEDLKTPIVGTYGYNAAFYVALAWPLVLTAMLPVWALASMSVQAARRRRILLGHCPKCGYDLRASSGRCPECGTAIAGKAEG
jgi:hypothetical protein